jgi:cell division septal protein FtsQ
MSYRKRHISSIKGRFKKRGPFYKKPGFWIAIVVILCGTCASLLLFPSQIQVKNINISGNDKIKTQDLQNLAWTDINKKLVSIGNGGVSSKSIFLASVGQISKDILTTFPIIETTQVKKGLFNTINIEVKERTPFAIFCNNGGQACFLMDDQGVIFQLADPGQHMLMIDSGDNAQIAIGQSPIGKKIVGGIKNLQKNLQDNFQLKITRVLATNPLIITTQEGWKIYFDPTADLNSQITKLDLLLQQSILPGMRKNLQYIYLQYQDRAYYK